MNDKGKKEAQAAASASGQQQYDPATLLALYSMSNAFGMGGMGAAAGVGAAASTGASGLAGSNATSNPYASNQLGINQWYAMASQLAAQEYLSKIQAAARDPQAYAALAAQGVLPNYEMLTGGSKARLKLPNDTEIIKYTSSATGSKEPGNSTRGRKKTISLDPNLSNADYASLAGNISSSSNDSTPPSIPAGLTIERKSRKNAGNFSRNFLRQNLILMSKKNLLKCCTQCAVFRGIICLFICLLQTNLFEGRSFWQSH